MLMLMIEPQGQEIGPAEIGVKATVKNENATKPATSLSFNDPKILLFLPFFRLLILITSCSFVIPKHFNIK